MSRPPFRGHGKAARVFRLKPSEFGAYMRRRFAKISGRLALRFRALCDESARQRFRVPEVQQKYVPQPFAGRITLFLARSSVYRISPKHDPRLLWSTLQAKKGWMSTECPASMIPSCASPKSVSLGRYCATLSSARPARALANLDMWCCLPRA
jgi:hypothetical protein